MIWSKLTSRKFRAGAIASAVLLVALVGSSAALAASPWWHLVSFPRPTVMQPGVAKDEVQEVKIAATSGEFSLEDEEEDQQHQRYANTPPLKFDATHAEVQAGLETVYGAGNVEVSGGPGDEKGTKPYIVTFKGALADQSLRAMRLRGAGSGSEPTISTEGRSDGRLMLEASNLGDEPLNALGAPVTIADILPPGFKAVGIRGRSGEFGGASPGPMGCLLESLTCTFAGTLPSFNQVQVEVLVNVEASVKSGAINEFRVSGGNARSAAIRRPTTVGEESGQFGVNDYELDPEEEGGQTDTQAGSHPFQYTTTITLNETRQGEPVALAKDLHFKQPTGFFGNPTPFTKCTLQQFSDSEEGTLNKCPLASVVGVAKVWVHFFGETVPLTSNVYILEPATGEPARFGFLAEGSPVFLDTAIRTGGDYGVTVNVTNITQTASFQGSQVTFWGVPGDARHDNVRGFNCLTDEQVLRDPSWVTGHPCMTLGQTFPPPLLSMPTSCTGPLQSSVEGDSWKQPALVAGPVPTIDAMSAQDGCNRLPFSPSISVSPDGQAGSTPTGLTVRVHVPQDVDLATGGLDESTVRNTTVALPDGVTLAAGAADGLQSCSLEQVHLEDAVFPSCPDAAKVATVSIATPLLPNKLEGAVYLAAQNANPFGTLVAMYIVARDPVSGTLVKIPGKVLLDPTTGQLVATFENTPQLPFEDLEMHFFGGARAPLAMPAFCGTYTTSASIEGWAGNPPSTPSSSFQVLSGPNGTPCQSPLPFSPSLTAGTTSIQAGGFSPFTMTMSREDGNQDLRAIKLRMPPGMSGTLSTVKLCGEAQADAGTCGPESLIGHTTVSVGLGGNPYSVTGGQVFITGPYEGAPFGLSVVVPAKAGPYDFGIVVVRGKIEVDPITAQLTITTDSTGPYKIPTILDGIPLQIKHVNVVIDRPGFTFNPTNCSALAITGSLLSAGGSSATLSVPLQVTNCAVLAFKPKLTATTVGKTSRKTGASLKVKLVYPAGPYDANIARVKVDLPKQLPSRLTTLQKACPTVTFAANPADCPSGSIVGHAEATTPVLPVPLSGPAYFVSYGSAKFPELVVVLQGYGVTVDLHGETFISKAGITSSTFKTVPDVPVGTFELTLPNGPGSALAANGNLCTVKLAMPTSFIGQNGASIHTSTPISVTGCAKVKKGSKANPRHQTNSKHKTRK